LLPFIPLRKFNQIRILGYHRDLFFDSQSMGYHRGLFFDSQSMGFEISPTSCLGEDQL
jgi:hypothetical protein